ncbi:MAG: hypothetical protein JW947_05145 [Sedimentisphaerales bacterium]|nr:hypothetical protein [Sedimentisphaerales bacterium]
MKGTPKSPDNQDGTRSARSPVLRKAAAAGLVLIVLGGAFVSAALIYNNLSIVSDTDFAERVDKSISSAEQWVKNSRMDILQVKNAALLKMLKECNEFKANLLFDGIIENFMAMKVRPECWKRLIDPNWSIDELELNRTIEKESVDNKWVLYAIAKEEAKITPEAMHLFDPKRWQRRQLTHQLNALVTLKKRSRETNERLDELIEHLCRRLSSELVFDLAVVDVYIQKVAFILRAGHPEKIRIRWVERIIANQQPDGGWNDRWYFFTSNRRPIFNFASPPSDQHATIQALTALYLVKYRYPERFGLKKDGLVNK